MQTHIDFKGIIGKSVLNQSNIFPYQGILRKKKRIQKVLPVPNCLGERGLLLTTLLTSPLILLSFTFQLTMGNYAGVTGPRM